LKVIEVEKSNIANKYKIKDPIKHIVDSLTKYIFNQCSRSIFEEHKLVFSFFIASKIGIREKSISSDEYLFFLTGNKPGFDKFTKNPLSWLGDKEWGKLCMLQSVCIGFAEIQMSMIKNPEEFQH